MWRMWDLGEDVGFRQGGDVCVQRDGRGWEEEREGRRREREGGERRKEEQGRVEKREGGGGGNGGKGGKGEEEEMKEKGERGRRRRGGGGGGRGDRFDDAYAAWGRCDGDSMPMLDISERACRTVTMRPSRCFNSREATRAAAEACVARRSSVVHVEAISLYCKCRY